MLIKINNTDLVYNTALLFEEQDHDEQAYINNIAFDYNGANEALSDWQEESPMPRRYSKLVHDISGDAAIIRTSVTYHYNYPYGNPSMFACTQSFTIETI
jgi:hypothetical protein